MVCLPKTLIYINILSTHFVYTESKYFLMTLYNYNLHHYTCIYVQETTSLTSTLTDQVPTPTHTSTMTSPSSTVPTQTTGEGSDALLVYISAGVSGAVVVLVAATVTVISVSVCLRKRKNKQVNTTDKLAYHYSSGPETMKINDAYAEISDPSITTSTNDAYGITRGASDVTASQNEAYVATDGVCQSSGSGMRMKTNEAYADMSSAINEDAYTYVTQRTSVVLTATNAACNAHTSTDEIYDYPTSSTAGNDITTSSNEAYGMTSVNDAYLAMHELELNEECQYECVV